MNFIMKRIMMNGEIDLMRLLNKIEWADCFEQREINTDMGDIYVSFWNSDNWFIKTAEEMGIEENQKMGGMKFE